MQIFSSSQDAKTKFFGVSKWDFGPGNDLETVMSMLGKYAYVYQDRFKTKNELLQCFIVEILGDDPKNFGFGVDGE